MKKKIWKFRVNGIVSVSYWNSCKRLPNFVNVAALRARGHMFYIGLGKNIRKNMKKIFLSETIRLRALSS